MGFGNPLRFGKPLKKRPPSRFCSSSSSPNGFHFISVLIISFLSASKDTPDWFKALHLLPGLNFTRAGECALGVLSERLTASCSRAHVSGNRDDLPVSPGKRFESPIGMWKLRLL